MSAKIKKNTVILLISSLFAFSCLIYILYQINTNLVLALNIYKTSFELRHFLIGFGHLFILFYHFYAVIYIFTHFRRFKELKLLKTVLLILGVISFFAMGGEKVMVDEIAREYRHGLGIGELNILNSFYLINMVFCILMLLLLLKTFNLVENSESQAKFIEEKIFTLAQYMGIFSGLMGVLFTLHLLQFIGMEILRDKYWIFLPFYVMFLTPYALAAIYWLSLKRKQRITDWYDEKQIQDMLKSSLTTLLLSVPGLAVLLIFQIQHAVFWLSYYIFLILLLFSGSTLYYFKFKD